MSKDIDIDIDQILGDLELPVQDASEPKVEEVVEEIEEEQVLQVTKDVDGQPNLARSIADFFIKYAVIEEKQRDRAEEVADEFFDQLKSAEMYNRQQLIADLIWMVKQGNANASKILIEMLGFDAASERYVMNVIDYKDIDVDDSFFEVKETNG